MTDQTNLHGDVVVSADVKEIVGEDKRFMYFSANNWKIRIDYEDLIDMPPDDGDVLAMCQRRARIIDKKRLPLPAGAWDKAMRELCDMIVDYIQRM